VLGISVINFNINPVEPVQAMVPTQGVSIADARAQGVGDTDLVHLLFTYVGGGDMQPEVAVIEGLLAPGTVSAVVAVFQGLFPAMTQAQTEGQALAALANCPAVQTALGAVLA
jgi:hypothetical protein